MNDLHELEQSVFTTSRCYQDSTAFQHALNYIKKNDLALYESLLETEGYESGIL